MIALLESLRGNRTYAVAIATMLAFAAAWFGDTSIATSDTLKEIGGVGLALVGAFLRAGVANDTRKKLDAMSDAERASAARHQEVMDAFQKIVGGK